MKTLLILLLALMTGFVSAMPAHRPYRKPLKPARVVETTHPVSWKTVAAGGAAAGTVVAAYKLSDGVQEGMKTAAEKAPVTFLSSVTLFHHPAGGSRHRHSARRILHPDAPLTLTPQPKGYNMEIALNKTELAGALAALGKLVCRTSLVKMFQTVQIEGRANALYFRTRNVVEEIEFRMDADLEDDVPAVLVEFEQFRLAVRNCKKKTLDLEIKNGEVYIDGVMLAPVNGRFPVPDDIPDQDACVTALPADTLSALSMLAPLADKGQDIRKVLGGINISRDGFTATNGKELSNIPLSLEMTGSVTIPFPLALLATKAFGESGKFTTWQKDDDTHFELSLGSWTWRAKAFRENYPNWKCVVPERTEKTHYVSFLPDRVERLQRYLKSVPDDPQNNNGITLGRLPEVPDNLHLESSNGILLSILAEFDPNWGDLRFTVRKEFLAHLLNAGHTRIELNDAYGPVVGSGGTGQYIAMPIRPMKPQAASEQKQEETTPESKEQTTTINTTPTPSTKEKPTMIDTNTITHVVSAASAQTFTPNNEPANPLDELTANIEAMKAKLKAMYDESAVMSRKVREVAIAQRQKEREYVQTKRTIERIRTASGF